MARSAVSYKIDTGTGVIGRVRDKNRFRAIWLFNLEFLEIGEVVWSNRIFPIVFSRVAFDSRCHITKQMRNAGAWYEQALVQWNPNILKIENFMKK